MRLGCGARYKFSSTRFGSSTSVLDMIFHGSAISLRSFSPRDRHLRAVYCTRPHPARAQYQA